MKDEEKKEASVSNEKASVKAEKVGKKALDAVKETGSKGINEAKKFSEKSFGKFKGLHIMIVGVVIVVLLLLVVIGKSSGSDVDYPVVYNNSDGDLYLMTTKVKKEEKAVKLSSGDSVSDVLYANTNNRYVLFSKNESLYIYDSKSKDETTKLVSDTDGYAFSTDDSYVIATDTDDNLYSYNFKGDKEKLDSDVESILDYTDSKILYSKDGSLYVRSLKASKDDKEKVVEGYESASFSEDGKYIIYINEDEELYRYKVSNGKADKIASDVTSYYCGTGSCAKMYYVVSDGDKVLYYYNGKEGNKLTDELETVKDIDVDNQEVVYTVLDGDEYTLYYQKGTKEAVTIEDDLEGIKSVRIFKGKEIYYITSDAEVKYAKISGAKVGEVSTLAEDVDSSLYLYSKGYAVVADVDEDSNSGDLYLLKGGKAKKIDSDVYASNITVSNDGTDVYYLKDYKSTGDLYVTTGGKGKKIDSDVHSYEYVKDKLIYYIKDYSTSKSRGDLYRYTGKSVKIAEDVTRLASTPNSFSLDD